MREETETDEERSASLAEAAWRVMRGDPATALARLRKALARGGSSLFAAMGRLLAERAPFDARLVADALARLHASAMNDALAASARLRARNRALARRVRHDPLTKVASRPTLLEQLDTELRRADRHGQSVAVLFIDIDHFKRVNDALGHAAGDRVLRQVAATIARGLRPGDVVGRYGGEEFVVGLVASDAQAAFRTAERLRHAIAKMKVESGARVTISIGVAASSPTERLALAELIDRADHAMLAAKARGRNATCAWSEA